MAMTTAERRALLQKQKLSYPTLANRTGLSRGVVKEAIEGARTSPHAERMIARLLGHTVENLFGPVAPVAAVADATRWDRFREDNA